MEDVFTAQNGWPPLFHYHYTWCTSFRSNDCFSAVAPETVQNLIARVKYYNLAAGLTNSLTAKLSNASRFIQAGQYTPAKHMINAFIGDVQAQRGKEIGKSQADKLVQEAQRILASFP